MVLVSLVTNTVGDILIFIALLGLVVAKGISFGIHADKLYGVL